MPNTAFARPLMIAAMLFLIGCGGGGSGGTGGSGGGTICCPGAPSCPQG